MTRSVEDATIVLSIIVGIDENDAATHLQPSSVPGYTQALDPNALRGRRIGVPRHVFMDLKLDGLDPSVRKAFHTALDVLRSLGAEAVDPADLPAADDIITSPNEMHVLETDFKVSQKSPQLCPLKVLTFTRST